MNQILRYIKANWLPLLMVLMPSGLFLGPIPYSSIVYYIFLGFMALLAFVKCEKVSILPILFLFCCAISIILGNPSPIFKSWSRLLLFCLLLMAYFPIFKSQYFAELRQRSLYPMLYLMTFTAVGSFICYFIGINYMARSFGAFVDSISNDNTGWFGGLTYHSMMLGPICAIALTIEVWYLLHKDLSNKIKLLMLCVIFSTFCCMLLTASRGANMAGIIGVAVVTMIRYRGRLGKLSKICITLIISLAALYPIYAPYADKLISKQKANELSGSTFASREERWEHRLSEFSEYPIFGYGFAAINTNYSNEYQKSSGIIEPGSSWLALLSMTGIAGFICFLSMFLSTIKNLYRYYNNYYDEIALLHLGILSIFAVHFISEGYIFSGGGALCFLFWFFFGNAYSHVYEYNSSEID